MQAANRHPSGESCGRRMRVTGLSGCGRAHGLPSSHARRVGRPPLRFSALTVRNRGAGGRARIHLTAGGAGADQIPVADDICCVDFEGRPSASVDARCHRETWARIGHRRPLWTVAGRCRPDKPVPSAIRAALHPLRHICRSKLR